MAVIFYWERTKERNIGKRLMMWVFFIFLFCAFFLAWETEYVGRESAEQSSITFSNNAAMYQKRFEGLSDAMQIAKSTNQQTLSGLNITATSNSAPTFQAQPGGAMSFGQNGGITAGTLIVTNAGLQPPQVEFQYETTNQPDGDHFTTAVIFNVTADYAVPDLKFLIKGHSIINLGIGSIPGDRSTTESYQKGKFTSGVWFVKFNPTNGKHRVLIVTSQPDTFEFGASK